MPLWRRSIRCVVMRPATTTALLLVFCALAVAPAQATHPASPEESAMIALQTSASAMPGEPAGCYKVDLADVDPTWARVQFVGEPFQNGCGGGAGGEAWVHDAPLGRWYVDKAGGSGIGELCPGPIENGPMPEAVAIELGFCVGPSKRIYVRDFQRETFVYKPSNLPQGAHGGYQHLRWTGWGTAQAIGHGTFIYADRAEEQEGYLPRGGLHVPIRIVLSHVVACQAGGQRMYRDERASYVAPPAPALRGGFRRGATLHLRCPPAAP